MAMTVLNNASTMMSLGELNKNITEVGKQIAKVSSGQRIVGAKDGASDFAISEKMRVKLRAGGQNDINVKAGCSMLRVAEAGIQEQIKLMRSIQSKVIDACNDTNTEADRATIQKQIDQYYQQIQDIAVETEYNGRKLLMGGDFRMETAYFWRKMSGTEIMDDMEMDIIPDIYGTLDGIEGPFDIFTEYTGTEPSSIAALGLSYTQNLAGGTDGTKHTFEMDVSSYGSVDALDGIGFIVGGRKYVFAKTTGRSYRESVTEISLSGCSSLNEAVNRAVSTVNSYSGSKVTAENRDGKIVFTAKENSPAADGETVEALTLAGGTEHVPEVPGRDAVDSTGLKGIPGSFSGGKDATGSPAVPGDPDSHDTYVPATTAKLSLSVSGAKAETGFTITDGIYPYNRYCIEFTEGSAGLTRVDTRSVGGTTYYYYKVGKDASVSRTSFPGNIDFELSGGTLTLTARTAGSSGNRHSVSDGIAGIPSTPEHDVTYTAVRPYDVSHVRSLTNWKDDGKKAYREMDLTDYMTSDPGKLESFISNLVDKYISFSDYRTGSTGSVYSTLSKYSFVDSKYDLPLDSRVSIGYGTRIDLNELRGKVSAGKTVAEAFAELMQEKAGTTNIEPVFAEDSVADIITGVKFVATQSGTIGNSDTLTVTKLGGLRHYDIDYGSYFASHPVENLPEFLDGKGFRFYCATHEGQWFNIEFVNAAPGVGDGRPKSGTEGEDIKTIVIGVAGVTDAGSLVQAIYDQATPKLTGTDPDLNHFMRVSGNTKTGVLRIYDWRAYNVNTPAYDYQERGAKISDGAADNVVLMARDIYVQDLVIQHTDKQNMNIHVKIPRTTIDHILGFNPEEYEAGDFSVLSKEMRENLLGTKGQKGLLDRGIEYLLHANTLIGAQINRLDYAGENITNHNENLTASESTIRDADMAKEMVAYTKANVISQSSQSMLAQANQSLSSVLGLLQ